MSDEARNALEQRLARLRLPKKTLDERLAALESAEKVIIETKNVDEATVSLSQCVPAFATLNPVVTKVAKFLADAALSTPPTALPARSDSFDRLLNKYESIPADNPIEVQFFRPSDAATRTDDEDAALIARLTDELSVEKETEGLGVVDQFEKRLEGLKSFRPERGSSSAPSASQHEAGGGADEQVDMGPPPSFDLDDFERKARKRGGSSDESDTTEESTKSSGEEEDSE